MPPHVETRELEPGLTFYEISGRDQSDVLLEIERITGTAGAHIAQFEGPRRCASISDPIKQWRSRGTVRSLEHV